MIIYSSFSLKANKLTPKRISLQADTLFEKYKEYCESVETRRMRLPIESTGYHEIKKFIDENNRYYSYHERFEREYTKAEMNDAEVFLLGTWCLALGYETYGIGDYFTYSCDKCMFLNEQIHDYQFPRKNWKNKELALSGHSTFYVSPSLRNLIDSIKPTNIKYRPAWTKKNELVAYKIEVEELMQPLANINNWQKYKKCEYCGKTVYDGSYKDQIVIPKAQHQLMHDFDATIEQFAEISGREYFISRRVYELLQHNKIKHLFLEPVKIIQDPEDW